MSPASAPVLGAAALVASPALWAAFVEGTEPASVALIRFLVLVGVFWLVFEIFTMLVVWPPAPALADDQAGDPASDEPTEVQPAP
ncbi:MAG: hypothetical protein ACXVW8_08010 [Nocardioidaceae bacterium]